MEVQPGDLLLTRNFGGEEANPSPGYYNHSAIISVKDWVVEAQAEPDSVIATPIWNFFDRYPEILVLRPTNPDTALATARTAPKYLGRKYALYMTVRPLWLWKDKDSCISLIRRIYNAVVGIDYKWRIPDSLTKVSWLEKVALKKDYENYKVPEDKFKGTINRWTGKSANEYLQ